MFLHADSEDCDQTGWMPRLTRVFAGRTATLLVLSCRGSYSFRLIPSLTQLSTQISNETETEVSFSLYEPFTWIQILLYFLDGAYRTFSE